MTRYLEKLMEVSPYPIRPAVAADFMAIGKLAHHIYTYPRWLLRNPANTWHYHSSWLACGNGTDIMKCAVAATPDAQIIGYVYYQFQIHGDLHIRELTALPVAERGDRHPLGSALLGYAIADGLDHGLHDCATANVLREHREIYPGVMWKDPVGFYEKFGYDIVDAVADLPDDSRFRSREDTWLSAPVASLFAAVVDYLQSKRVNVTPESPAS